MEKKVVLLDFFDACVVFFGRKPWNLVSDGCLDAPSIIGRQSVAKLIENASFRSFEVYGTITLLYLLLSWLMMQAFKVVGRHYFSYPVK